MISISTRNRPNYLSRLLHYYKPKILAESLKYVMSKFVVLCADDDFLVPESIMKCAKLLKENSDYSISHGLGVRMISGSFMI